MLQLDARAQIRQAFFSRLEWHEKRKHNGETRRRRCWENWSIHFHEDLVFSDCQRHTRVSRNRNLLDLSFNETSKSFRRLATVKGKPRADLQSNLIGTRRGNRLRLIPDNYSLCFFVARPIDVFALIVRMKNTVLGRWARPTSETYLFDDDCLERTDWPCSFIKNWSLLLV